MRPESDKDIIVRVNHLMVTEHLYKDPSLSLVTLSVIVKVPRNRLSRVINAELGMNFNAYVNGFRVKAAAQILSNPEHCPKKVLELYKVVGFPSKSTYYKIFKETMGIPPATFKRKKRAELSLIRHQAYVKESPMVELEHLSLVQV